jgi:hypothetical protein
LVDLREDVNSQTSSLKDEGINQNNNQFTASFTPGRNHEEVEETKGLKDDDLDITKVD